MTDIIDLETKIAYLEQSLNELSDVVYKQQQHIDQMVLQIQNLQDSSTANKPMATDEKPPHY